MAERYRDAENYDGVPVVLNDTRVILCNTCGSLVLDKETHEAWHKSINAIATDFYGVDTEID